MRRGTLVRCVSWAYLWPNSESKVTAVAPLLCLNVGEMSLVVVAILNSDRHSMTYVVSPAGAGWVYSEKLVAVPSRCLKMRA